MSNTQKLFFMSQPPEEKEVNKIVSEAKAKDKGIEETIHYEQPTPNPTPPNGGMETGPEPGQKTADTVADKAKEANRQDTLHKAAEAIKGAPVNTGAKAFKTVDEYAYPDTAPPIGKKNEKGLDQSQDFAKSQMKDEKPQQKSMDEAQQSAMHKMGYTDMRTRHEKQKDISESQDYAMRRLGDEKEKERAQPQKEAEPFKEAHMTKSFSQSLGYAKLYQPVEKTNGNKEDKEGKTDKTPMSMSGRFSATLGYDKMLAADAKESSTPDRETKSKEPDLDR